MACASTRCLTAVRTGFLCVLALQLLLGAAAPSRNLVKVTATRSRPAVGAAASECAPLPDCCVTPGTYRPCKLLTSGGQTVLQVAAPDAAAADV